MRRMAWTVLLLIVIGCSKAPALTAPAVPANPATPPPAVQAEAPTAVQPPAAAFDPCDPPGGYFAALEVWGHFTARRMEPPGGCQFVIDTHPITVTARAVKAPTAAEAAQAVQVAGAALLGPASASNDGNGGWQVFLSLGPGAAGDKVTVTLTPAPGEQPVIASLLRKAGPTVTVSLLGSDGTWAPLRSGASLPPGPKRLRVQAPGVALGANNLYYYGPGWMTPVNIDSFQQTAPDTVEVGFAAPPAMVQIVVDGSDDDGLWLVENSRHFYIGEPPVLEVFDPKGGQSTRVGEVPPEILQTAVRKDGRYAALTTLDPAAGEGYQDWIVDLQTGQVTMLPFAAAVDQSYGGFDARGRLVAPLDWGRIGLWDPAAKAPAVQSSAATFWGPVSPDGRYIAGRDGSPFGRSTGAWVGPPRVYHLIIRDLLTDSERMLPWPGNYAWGFFWLPDGRLVQMTSENARDPSLGPPTPDTALRCNAVDPQTGSAAAYDGVCQYPQRQPVALEPADGGHFLAWLPDGRALVVRWSNWENQRRPLGP